MCYYESPRVFKNTNYYDINYFHLKDSARRPCTTCVYLYKTTIPINI